MKVEIAFGRKKWAVVGASTDPSSFGYKVYDMLKRAGFVVYPVSPKYTEVLGDPCYATLQDLPEKVDMVSMVVNPKIGKAIVASYSEKPHYWFQPGAYDDELVEMTKGHCTAGPCVLVEHGKADAKMRKHIETIVSWLRTKVEETKTDGLVLGLSGGVDSAVVGALMAKAIPEKAMSLILPCYSNPEDVVHGRKVAEVIGLKTEVIDLTEAHRLIMDALQFPEEPEKAGALRSADSNLRARLRMSTLYAYANRYNALVVGTDNAAELYIGYFTKYGDGGVDLLPIAELVKAEVYHLGRILGVPKEVLYKAPSAGLWEGQTDEGEIGTTYDIIDGYLLGEEVEERSAVIIERMHRASAHKRSTPPYPTLEVRGLKK